jgi:predicted GIY-YIG superfamily endonuclease
MKTRYTYLLHFDRPYKHARHYIGSADKLQPRMSEHLRGKGSRLIQVIQACGIAWQLVAVWKGGRQFERGLKNRKDATQICPLCIVDRRKRKAQSKRSRQASRKLFILNANLPEGSQQGLFL